jgi:hypothetical protein
MTMSDKIWQTEFLKKILDDDERANAVSEAKGKKK